MQEKLILFIDSNFYSKLELWENLGNAFTIHTLTNGVEAYKWLLEGNKPDIIISEFYLPGYSGLSLLSNVRRNPDLKDIPFILVCDHNIDSNIIKAKELGANDIYLRPLSYGRLKTRIETLIKLKEQKIEINKTRLSGGISFKKVAQAVLAFAIFALLSPVFIFIAVLIKLESPGPIFQVTPRIGKGYKKIKDYRFRAFRWQKSLNARLSDQYSLQVSGTEPCPDCMKTGRHCSPLLHIDGMSICENQYKNQRSRFLNNENMLDKEITTFGKILRKTKMDSLPNLINVINGNMSFLGEEALMPEVAEKFTNDKDSNKLLAEVGVFPNYIKASELLVDLSDN